MSDEENLIAAATTEANRLDAEMKAVLGGDDEVALGRLAVLHEQARTQEGLVCDLKERLAREILMRMERMGIESVRVNGRRLGVIEREFYGINHESPNALNNVKAWLEEVAPEANIPASTNIKKAMEAYLDETPGAMTPDFIRVTKTRSLVNAKA